jgi:RimJ/RimL family protein N-acetyltransferase
MFRTEFWGKGFASEAMEYWLQAWWNLPRRDIDIKSDDANESDSTKVVPEKLKADVVVTNHASLRILEKFGFIPVSEEIVDDHQIPGQKIKVITLELQRP